MAGRQAFLLWGGICFIYFLKIEISSSQYGVSRCRKLNSIPRNAECLEDSSRYFFKCKPGFESNTGYEEFTDPGVICQDIEECLQDSTLCPKYGKCTNTIGSYYCTCKGNLVSSNGKVNFTEKGVTCEDTKSRCSDADKDTFSRNCDEQLNAVNSQEICARLRHISRACENGTATERLKSIANSFEILMNQKNRSQAETAQLVTLYLESVQKGAYEVALSLSPGSMPPVKEKFMVIKTLTFKGDCEKNNSTFKMEAGNEVMDIDCNIIAKKGSRGAAVFISYTSFETIMNKKFISKENLSNGEKLTNIYLNSKVVSGTSGYMNASSLSIPVNFTFLNTKMRSEKEKPLCVYWTNTVWSKEGCEAIWYDDTKTVCSCYHLSSFAVLMASTGLQEDFVLTMITKMGLILSLLCLFPAVLIFLLCRSIQSTTTSLHLHLSLCLFFADLLFLTGIKITKPKILCSIIAGGLQYLYLAAFTWMFLEGLHLFLTVRNLKIANYTSASRFKKRFMYPFGYGIPTVIVALSVAIVPHGYGTDDYCWLKRQKGVKWSFMGPVFVIILINLCFYLTILWILRDRLSSLNKEVSTIQNTRTLTFKALAQLFILGCSWSLGFFLIESIGEPVKSIIAYAFSIINSLQGIYIFLVHCILNHQVQEEFKKCCKGIKKRTVTETYAVTSTSQIQMENLSSS